MWTCKYLVWIAQARSVFCRKLSISQNSNGYNSKHLEKGDPLPPYNGKLRLYNMRFCPFAHRTVLTLNAKEVDYEIVNVNLVNKPEWLFEKSEFGKVPALEIANNITIYESLVTVEYLEDVYPKRQLLPKSPLQKAQSKILVEASGALHNLFLKLVKRPESVNQYNLEEFHKSMQIIQKNLKNGSKMFLHGSEPGYADYMIWPWFERLLAIQDFDYRAKIDAEQYIVLLNYINNMMQDPIVTDYLIPTDIFQQFHEGFQNGRGPNYDLLLEK